MINEDNNYIESPDDEVKSDPESEISEWKVSWRDEYMKWLCAYANTDGGKIYIGVNDDGYVMGLNNYRALLEEIPNKLNSKLRITAHVRLKHTSIRGKNIRYDNVPEDVSSKKINMYACGTFVPENDKQKKTLEKLEKETPVHQDPDGRFYYIEIEVDPYPNLITYRGVAYSRSGSTLQRYEGQDLIKAVMKSTGRQWDSFETVKKIEDLDKDALKWFREKSVEKKRLSQENAAVSDSLLIKNLKLLTEDGKLTRAAAMLFSDPEVIAPGAYIKIGYFAPAGAYGMNSDTDVIYHDDIHGPLITQADRTIELLYSKYLKAMISYKGLQRVEAYMLPQDAMREILLNAIAHKFYASGNPTQIKVFDDHITVMNAGFWPFEQFRIENAYTQEHSSYRNNPLIADGLYMAGEIETWGSGFKKIKRACERYGAPLPEISATSDSVTIRISPSEDYLKVLNRSNQTVKPDSRQAAYSRMKDVLNENFKEREKEIILPLIEYFADHDEVSAAKAAELIGMSVPTATRYINKMISLGLLSKTGESYKTSYRFLF